MTAYDGICRDMSGYQVGRIPDALKVLQVLAVLGKQLPRVD